MENDEIAITKVKDQLLGEIAEDVGQLVSQLNELDVVRLLKNIQSFQPSPQLLDKHLNGYITNLCNAYDLYNDSLSNSAIAEVFYQFTKVRGYKTISNCLSSNVYLLEPILDRIPQLSDWKQGFFMLLWLSVLILNPFLLSTISPEFSEKVYTVATRYFHNNSKELDAAAILMSRFLSRSDNLIYLQKFYETLQDDCSEYTKLGYLKTLNNLLKIGKLSNLKPYLTRHHEFIKNNLESESASILKYCIKNLGKLSGLISKIDEMEDMLEDIINYLMQKLDHNSTIIRYCVSRQLAKIAMMLEPEYQQDLLDSILQDLDIPSLNAESYAELDIDFDMVNVNKYHGALITIAEFLNLRLVKESNIPCIVSILHRTLFLEQNRLTYSVGSNIRDLSCYISWSMMKKYKNLDPTLLKYLFESLLLTCLFDKEIMIRRSASAVLQELIGRFGDLVYSQYSDWQLDQSHFKLKIIEILDFTVLGDVKKSFEISYQLTNALNPTFKVFFVKHLYESCFHSDYQIRKLSILHLVKFLSILEVDLLITEMITLGEIKPGFFYLLAELLEIHPGHIDTIAEMVSRQKFNSHRDSFTKGEELLYIISVLLKHNDQIFNANIDLIFSIIRVSKSPEILSKFLLVVANLPYISDEIFEKFLYNLKMGNNLAVANSLRALNHLNLSQLASLFDIIEDRKQDSDVRASIIDSLSVYYRKDNFQDVIKIINLLDDYTITSQGDVGSKLRLSTIHFINDNLTLLQRDQGLIRYINTKLIRLNFDMIDKLRQESFSLFLQTTGWDYQLQEGVSYFETLLQLYRQQLLLNEDKYYTILSREFWKGYSTLAGAVISSNKLIQSAILQLVKFLDKLATESERLSVFEQISLILSKVTQFSISEEECLELSVPLFDVEAHNLKCKERLYKLQTSVLLLLQRFFEWNVKLPLGFDFRSLFAKVYNLQLNQLNQSRLKPCFKIFKYLYLTQNGDDKFLERGKQRLIQLMCTSKHDRVRVSCSETLFELYHELQGDNSIYLKKIDEVDWSFNGNYTAYLKFFK